MYSKGQERLLLAAFRSTNSKRMQHNEDNRRSSYQPAETLFSGLGPMLAAFGGEAQQVMPVSDFSHIFYTVMHLCFPISLYINIS